MKQTPGDASVDLFGKFGLAGEKLRYIISTIIIVHIYWASISFGTSPCFLLQLLMLFFFSSILYFFVMLHATNSIKSK